MLLMSFVVIIKVLEPRRLTSDDVGREKQVLSFLLVDISTSFGENLYANVSLLRNRKFDLISQSGWIILHARDYQL